MFGFRVGNSSFFGYCSFFNCRSFRYWSFVPNTAVVSWNWNWRTIGLTSSWKLILLKLIVDLSRSVTLLFVSFLLRSTSVVPVEVASMRFSVRVGLVNVGEFITVDFSSRQWSVAGCAWLIQLAAVLVTILEAILVTILVFDLKTVSVTVLVLNLSPVCTKGLRFDGLNVAHCGLVIDH